MNIPVLGYVLNNSRLNNSLLQAVTDLPVRYFDNTRVCAAATSADGVVIQCQRGGSSTVAATQVAAAEVNETFAINARLLIAADGSSSSIREWMGIAVRHVDYDQIAVMNTVEFEHPHHGTAYERFTESGPLAFLPRGQSRMNVVNCVSAEDRSTMEAMEDEQYQQHVLRQFGNRLGRITDLGSRVYVPLVRIEASSQSAERVLLLGNAMRLLHPVGGQGYNLAMRDVAALVKLLDRTDNTGAGLAIDDPGAPSLLQSYVEQRRADQQRVSQFTDLLARGFRGNASLPAHARGLGLTILDAVSPLRRSFASFTTGSVD